MTDDAIQELIDSKQISQLVLSSMSQGLSIVGEDMKFSYVNQAYADMLGYEIEEFMGKSPFEFIPEDQLSILEEQRSNRLKGGTSQYEIHLTHKNGSRVKVLLTGVPIMRDGKFKGSVAIINDLSTITGLQRNISETTTRFVTLISRLNSGILLEDQERRILLTNRNFCDIFEIPAQPEELIGQDCRNSAQFSKHLVQDPEAFISSIDKLVEKREQRLSEEIVFKNGKVYERDFIPIFNNDDFLGLLWVYDDITIRKLTEHNLKRAKESAEQSERQKQNFLAKMSHEIRTPMNGVMGIVHLLRETELTEEQARYLDLLNASSEHLLQILNDILDVSKIEEGKLVLNEKPVFIPELIRQVTDTLAPKIEQKSLDLKLSGLDTFKVNVLGDPLRLRQILFNLLSNSIKFTDKGCIHVDAQILSSNSTKSLIQISVKDTGIGIPKAKQKNIFEAFDQGAKNTTEQFGGTGLGLNIVRELIEKMGGEIHLESEEGKGSSFVIRLTMEVDQKHGPRMHRDADRSFQKNIFKGKKILIVDDNRINYMVAKKLVEQWGAETTYAIHGKDALEKLEEDHFDLIFMDMQMPVMDGIEASKRIREQMKSIPIIAMTAAALKEERVKCLKAGMDDYVSKPYDPSVLYRVMYDWLIDLD